MTRLLVAAVAAVAIVMVLLPSPSRGHLYSAKSCKTVPGMADFDIEKFFGFWYVTHIYDSIFSCNMIDYHPDFSDTEGDGNKELYINHYHLSALLDAMDVDYKSLFPSEAISDESVPSQMTIKNWPNKVAGHMSHVVVDTDYTSYALTYECQGIWFQLGSRFSVSILSRNETIDPDLVLQIRKTAAAKGIPGLRNLKFVDRGGCDGGYDSGVGGGGFGAGGSYHYHFEVGDVTVDYYYPESSQTNIPLDNQTDQYMAVFPVT